MAHKKRWDDTSYQIKHELALLSEMKNPLQFLAVYAESSYQIGNTRLSASHWVSSSHFRYKGDVKTNWWEFEAEHSFPLSSLHAYPPPNIWRGWKNCYIRSLLNIELVNGLYWFIYASLTWCWQQHSDECSIKSMWKRRGYNFLFMSVRLWFSRYWLVKAILCGTCSCAILGVFWPKSYCQKEEPVFQEWHVLLICSSLAWLFFSKDFWDAG